MVAVCESSKDHAISQISDAPLRPLLWTLLLGGSVVSISNSALNPAIPVFMSVFSVDIVTGGWVLNAYVLAMSIGLMVSGYISKRFVFKRVYILAMFGFMLGSVLGMLAESMTMVIAARAMQGLSGGLIIPLSIGMLYQVYPKSKHGRVMALWGIVVMMALAFGPLLGAYLVEHFAWWTLFAVTLPLSVAVLLLSWRLPALVNDKDNAKKNQPARFDTLGFVGLLLWLLALMAWLSSLKTDAANALQTGAIALAFVFAFVLWWRYEAKQSTPLINVRLFVQRTYLHTTLISITQTIGLMIGLLLLPIIVQDVMGSSALWTGAILMAATVVSSVTTHFAGRQVDKHGARTIGLVGIALGALSMLLLAASLYQPTLWLLFIVMSVQGVGVGLAYLPTTSVGLSSLDKSVVTEGAALNNISRRIVSTIVITLVTVYVAGRDAVSVTHQTLGALTTAAAIQDVFVVLAVVLLSTLFCAYRLPKHAAQ
ncbi:MFS transporter [Psychrobacter aestuarii]|uniref:DHA2 family efflux MFS transporter permease subunit n=1 Tax=Psychrobacter aestuarii TaxID=556327 RepID=A0ABN0VPV5_9GAMM|nr:MFS transporter [Psychrobacter aestuarii]